MRYQHLLVLPSVIHSSVALSLDDVQPLTWNSPGSWTKYTPVAEGTCSSAVDVMAYHREKMNEYLCKKFLAEEILEAEDRKDEKYEETAENRAIPHLMKDTGSLQYKDWLARSTTLEDIYRHYEQSAAEDAPIGTSLLPADFDGEVTGYAMLGDRGAADTSGYGAGTSYAAPQYGQANKGLDKGMKLEDLFQLALTAIAFLAFGTFFVEVIMCVMGLETKSNSMKIMMFNGADSLEAMNYYKTEDVFKLDNQGHPTQEQPFSQEIKKSGSTIKSSRSFRAAKEWMSEIDRIETLAAKATASLNSLELLHQDNGKMLKATLCEANRYSRSLTGTHKIWLPLWSFGISYIAGQRLAHTPDSPFGTLQYLMATIQGMAGVNCSTIT